MSKLLLEKFDSLSKTNLRFYYGYGPTETNCFSTKIKINYDYHNPLVGFPAPNELIL